MDTELRRYLGGIFVLLSMITGILLMEMFVSYEVSVFLIAMVLAVLVGGGTYAIVIQREVQISGTDDQNDI
jgi:hypothetical protein